MGTDLSGSALASARAGSYDERAVHLVGPEERKRYFEEDAAAKRWTIKPEVRSLVTWKRHNLLTPLREEPFDCIFLKNVLIYFDTASKLDRRAERACRHGQGRVPGDRSHRGDLHDARPAHEAQALALPEARLSQAELTQEEPAMSGFDLSELLPFYLDESDEHIAALNDALLRLEQDPTDAKALAEAFRMFHSIKGASVVMGFDPVNRLTHNLESLFDQFRAKKRTLDRPVLDLTFRCLDELRDYHRELRAGGQSTVDLAALTPLVIEALNTAPSASEPATPLPATRHSRHRARTASPAVGPGPARCGSAASLRLS